MHVPTVGIISISYLPIKPNGKAHRWPTFSDHIWLTVEIILVVTTSIHKSSSCMLRQTISKAIDSQILTSIIIPK